MDALRKQMYTHNSAEDINRRFFEIDEEIHALIMEKRVLQRLKQIFLDCSNPNNEINAPIRAERDLPRVVLPSVKEPVSAKNTHICDKGKY